MERHGLFIEWSRVVDWLGLFYCLVPEFKVARSFHSVEAGFKAVRPFHWLEA